ncbi:hypothetical protein LTR05_001688 [Lithohypha guttulata]|uniref:Xylanolytic transcriptional activator regulatory domain-containing protein n=1 Tax=Lithohypha guttulata TaxID=1690604 RepID=A0AAN7T7Z2_9EURO|nr:hypothetical protein LTR05_001688 [Lithohypha guttulata]
MGDSKSNEALLQIIRSGATTDEIIQYVNDNPPRAKRTRRNMLDIVSLIDQPLVRVPAQPWTDVVQDDEAVSHLVSAYFAWNHSTYPILDRDTFTREMKSKNLSSQFCSEFLVNAILCIGCTYTDHPVAFAEHSDNSTRGLHFFKEAMRLWECSEGEVTLTNLQGLVAMLCCTFALGKDRIGLLYTPQLIALRRDLIMKVRKNRKLGSRDYANQDFKRAYALAVWGSFNIEV